MSGNQLDAIDEEGSAFASLVGQKITATATDTSTGDTSEFSFPAFPVSPG